MKLVLAIVGATLLAGAAGCGDPQFSGAPDVRGLNLADANAELKRDGFRSSVVENDGFFGVVIEENFVVCGQQDTQGKLVPLEVAKHGC
jgi:beta-lactam-binding protein with PASTA domain